MTLPPLPPPIPQQESDKRFSLLDVIGMAEQSCRRFPVTICYIIYAVIVAEMSIWDYRIDSAFQYTAILGPLLTLAAYIWCEPYAKSRAEIKTFVQVIVNLAIIGDLVYMLMTEHFGEAETAGHVAAVAASAIAIFFAPARGNAIRAWRFSYRQTVSAIIAALISSAVEIAIVIIMMALFMLLKYGDDMARMIFTIAIVLAVALPLMIFISRITYPDDTDLDRHEEPRIIVALVKYLFLPLLGAYMLVLYIYGIKILVTWELPEGYVTWSVTALVAEVLVVEFFLFPLSEKSLRPLGGLIKTALPALTLPLLVLMSVAIGYRINQYGFTTDRLYVLTFNIWCYAIMGYLFIDRCRHINPIPLSFSAVMLVTSIIPGVNYSTLGAMLQREDTTTDDDATIVETIELPDEEVIEEVSDEEIEAIHESSVKKKGLVTYRWEVSPDKMIAVPHGVTGMKPFMCPVKNVIPDKKGLISVGTSEARGKLNIDSLVACGDSLAFKPILVKVPGQPDKKLLITAMTVTTRLHNDSVNAGVHSVSARIDGYIFEYNLNTK